MNELMRRGWDVLRARLKQPIITSYDERIERR